MFKLASLVVIASAATAMASHTITLTNKCTGGVPVWVDSTYSPVAYVSTERLVMRQKKAY